MARGRKTSISAFHIYRIEKNIEMRIPPPPIIDILSPFTYIKIVCVQKVRLRIILETSEYIIFYMR